MICSFLHKSGFHHQKMVLVTEQRDDYLRSVFIHDTALYKPEMFILLDETGADKRNAIRKYGYSVRGKPAISHVFFDRGGHLSAIAAMSSRGFLDVKLVEGGVNGYSLYTLTYYLISNHSMGKIPIALLCWIMQRL